MDIKTSSRCWGYSRRPKNWRKFMAEADGYDLFDLMAKQSPMKSRTLTPEEVRELGLPTEFTSLNEFPDSQPDQPKPQPARPVAPKPQPIEDPSSSYL